MSTILSPNKYAGRNKAIRLIVIHTMEVDENDPNVAESVGNYFARPATRASSHVGVDTDSECRYVADSDTAWAAPGANADGLQIELAGRAGQFWDDWLDDASQAILERAAQRVAQWCAAYGIPVRHLSDSEILAGARGIVGHADVNHVYSLSNHWDPGPAFPWDTFLARVNALAGWVPIVDTPTTPTTPSLLSVDGSWGPLTTKALQRLLGVTADGSFGPISTKALQRLLGVKEDGIFGPISKRALQHRLGVKEDGIVGPITIKALQTAINSGSL